MKRNTKRGATAWLQSRVKAMRRMLGGRLRLAGSGLALRLVVEAARPATDDAAPPSAPRDTGASSLPSMHAGHVDDARSDLKAILDQHPAARRLWPSLALIERGLGKHGGAGVARLSAAVLLDAAKVLDRLVDDWCAPGLIALYEHVCLVLRTIHGEDPPCASVRGPRGAEMQVQECTMTDFVTLDQLWDQRLAHEG